MCKQHEQDSEGELTQLEVAKATQISKESTTVPLAQSY